MLPLDNPIYSALATDQAPFALTNGLARRFPLEVSPLAGLRDGSPEAFADLRELAEPGDRFGLFTIAELEVPDDWELVGERWIDQMVLETPVEPVEGPPLVELGEADVPAMLALTAATQPGPFGARTFELGRYLGIRDGERLVAMAGERIRPEGAIEISAVCTDPDYLGRGYAKTLMTTLAAGIFAAGRQPILHVKTENGAKHLYEKLGFRVRRPARLTQIRRPR
ncbi:GNAT family N-acetyltransferase [Solirubrobacter ginsenosidimutans]|uniref:GNAT family N-acetyltransferase n=1 Tax=Solirubrobacter ginsenosidimutans TaxID=490573 RepID=A0A9X3S154_9ACTN|nr:GNAT family N-acetyltransferase [Solirubrobacter ginsenosidimutans]MDA0162990.1 GNAT family N-acetyltransferase [Solirubrobacter ginsenosidimutans]